MTELNNIQSECYQIARIEDEGEVLLRELIIKRGGKDYAIRVTTPSFLDELKRKNSLLDPDLRADDNALALPNIESVEEICRRISRFPLSELKPYLREQVEVAVGETSSDLDPILEDPFSGI